MVIAAHRNEIIKQLISSASEHLGERVGVLTANYTTPDKQIVTIVLPFARRKAPIQRLKGRNSRLSTSFFIVQCRQLQAGYQGAGAIALAWCDGNANLP